MYKLVYFTDDDVRYYAQVSVEAFNKAVREMYFGRVNNTPLYFVSYTRYTPEDEDDVEEYVEDFNDGSIAIADSLKEAISNCNFAELDLTYTERNREFPGTFMLKRTNGDVMVDIGKMRIIKSSDLAGYEFSFMKQPDAIEDMANMIQTAKCAPGNVYYEMPRTVATRNDARYAVLQRHGFINQVHPYRCKSAQFTCSYEHYKNCPLAHGGYHECCCENDLFVFKKGV